MFVIHMTVCHVKRNHSLAGFFRVSPGLCRSLWVFQYCSGSFRVFQSPSVYARVMQSFSESFKVFIFRSLSKSIKIFQSLEV